MLFEMPTMENPQKKEENPDSEKKGAADSPERLDAASSTENKEGETVITADTELKDLVFKRDPTKEVNVKIDREMVERRLGEILRLLKQTEQERRTGESTGTETATGAQSATAPSQKEMPAEKVEKLEKAKKILEADKKKIDLAEEYNDVLEDFSHLSKDDLADIEKTGLNKEGSKIKNKRGKELKPEEVKHLANLAFHGTKRMTWEAINKIYQVVDVFIGDVVDTLKRMAGLKKEKSA